MTACQGHIREVHFGSIHHVAVHLHGHKFWNLIRALALQNQQLLGDRWLSASDKRKN